MSSLLAFHSFITFGPAGLINLLINLLVLVLIILIVFWVLGLCGVPAQIQRIIAAIFGLILLLCLLGGCTTTSTTSPNGTVTSVRSVDQAAINSGMAAAEPLIREAVAVGVSQGLQSAIQAQSQGK